MQKTHVLKALTHYSFKNNDKCDSLSTTVKVSISFVRVCMRVFVRSLSHSVIHSLRYSMSVNYLKIMLDKFILSLCPLA